MLLLWISLLAAAPHDTGVCGEPDQIEECAQARYEKREVELGRYYDAALARWQKLDSKTAADIIRSQNLWMSYKNSECASVYDLYDADRSQQNLKKTLCEDRLTELRIYVIWDHWLTYDGDYPPILPRPKIEEQLRALESPK